MSDYILTSDGELYHYGVKGMKWGVRRAIGKNARSYAKDYYKRKLLSSDASYVDSKIKKTEAKLEKLRKEKRSYDKRISELSSVMKTKASQLSEKDIRQGKIEYVAGTIGKIAGVMTMTAAGAYLGSNATAKTVITTFSGIRGVGRVATSVREYVN